MSRNERQRMARMCLAAVRLRGQEVATETIDEGIREREAEEDRKFNQLVARGYFVEEKEE